MTIAEVNRIVGTKAKTVSGTKRAVRSKWDSLTPEQKKKLIRAAEGTTVGVSTALDKHVYI